MRDEKIPNAVGTYGSGELLRQGKNNSRTFLPKRPHLAELPGRAESMMDVEAFRRGEARVVSCFLQASFGRFPRRLTYGSLTVSADQSSWKPYLRLPWRQIKAINLRAGSVEVRPPGFKEPNVDHRQKICDGAVVCRWMVIMATDPQGTAKFVVPYPDVPLVTFWLRDDRNKG